MRTNTARQSKLGIVHPSSNNRIERIASEYRTLAAKIKELEEQRKALSARLVVMVKREGEPDEKGKLRYQTDAHKFVIVPGSSKTLNGDKAVQLLVKKGVKVAVARACITAATKTTDYEYVRVDERKQDTDDGADD